MTAIDALVVALEEVADEAAAAASTIMEVSLCRDNECVEVV